MSESMHTYLLNKATISHYNYHWFWGLRCNIRVPAINLTVFMEELEQNESLLLSLQTQQKQVTERSALTRFFFRWFNINNYAHNSYKLAALDAYKEFTEGYGNSAAEESRYPRYGVRSEPLKVSSLDWAKQRMIKLLFPAYRIGLSYYTEPKKPQTTSPKPAPSENFQPESNPKVGQHFMVTPGMLSYLSVLNIQEKSGAYLSWREVKQAFQREALRRHPDKPGGSHELFCELKPALESLEALVFPKQGSQPELKQQWDAYFADALKELYQTLATVHSTFDRVEEIYDGIRQTHKEMRQTHDETERTLDTTERALDELEQTRRETAQRLTKLEANMAAYIRSTRQQVEQKPEANPAATTTITAVQQPRLPVIPPQLGFFPPEPTLPSPVANPSATPTPS